MKKLRRIVCLFFGHDHIGTNETTFCIRCRNFFKIEKKIDSEEIKFRKKIDDFITAKEDYYRSKSKEETIVTCINCQGVNKNEGDDIKV